jgi:hypothetical protein
LAHIDATHEVGAHLKVYLLLCGQLQGAADAHTGIVHQHVHPTLLFDDVRYHGGYLLAVSNIALTIFNIALRGHGAAAETVNDMSFRGQEFGRGLAKARRGAGDDDYLLHDFSSVFGLQKYEKK